MPSIDASGDAASFPSQAETLLDAHGPSLLALAYGAIDHGLSHRSPLTVDPADYPPALRSAYASFVTLRRGHRLLGCIGSSEAFRPLVVDVADNAFAAANRDVRFIPVSRHDRADLAVSVTILGPWIPLRVKDDADLAAQLRVGEDGLILEADGRRALFLPQVWSMLPEPARFIAQLKQKTGLPIEAWCGGYRAWRFEARSVSADPRPDGDQLRGERRR